MSYTDFFQAATKHAPIHYQCRLAGGDFGTDCSCLLINSQEGFKYSLATGTHGGVQVMGDIRQEAIINLVVLRTLTADLSLKRYLLGLSLVALSYRDQQCFNLREGTCWTRLIACVCEGITSYSAMNSAGAGTSNHQNEF